MEPTSQQTLLSAALKLAAILAASIAVTWSAAWLLTPKSGLIFPNSDFEEGTLKNWRGEGNAFSGQPVFEDNAAARNAGSAGLQGKYWIGTYEKRPDAAAAKGTFQGNTPTGKLTSQTFVLRKSPLAFLAGAGSGSRETSVTLMINGKTVLAETPNALASARETMQRVTWDVRPWLGQKANIVIYDGSSQAWGHINADDFRYA